MSNAYYNFSSPLIPAATARSADINTELAAIEAGFALVDADTALLTTAGTNLSITAAKTRVAGILSATAEYNNGNSGSSISINPLNGNRQKVTLSAATPAITITSFSGISGTDTMTMVLKVIQDPAVARVPTWVNLTQSKCVGNAFPTIPAGLSAVAFITFYWDGTAWWAQTQSWA